MIKTFISAFAFSIVALSGVSLADTPVPAAAATSEHHLNATHDTSGLGVRGHHPTHGKVHGHKSVHVCMKHCQDHHKDHADAAHKKAMIKECEAICHDHHTGAAPVNPTGVSRSGTVRGAGK